MVQRATNDAGSMPNDLLMIANTGIRRNTHRNSAYVCFGNKRSSNDGCWRGSGQVGSAFTFIVIDNRNGDTFPLGDIRQSFNEFAALVWDKIEAQNV
jgi:hypothetical protein